MFLNLLVGDHDLEGARDLSQRYARVLLPRFEVVFGVDEDNEVFILAFVVDLGDIDVSARHGRFNGYTVYLGKEIGIHAMQACASRA